MARPTLDLTGGRLAGGLTLALAAVLLQMVLAVPNRPSALGPAAFARLPLELPMLLGAVLALAPHHRISRGVRALVVALLVGMLVLKAADFAIYESFGRPFNVVIDMVVVPAGLNLLTGAVGRPGALAIAGGAVLGLGLVAWMLWWALARWSRPDLSRTGRRTAGGIAIVAAALVVAEAGKGRAWTLPLDPPGQALTARLAVQHAIRTRTAARDLAAYNVAAETDPWSGADGLFDLLDGRDVLIVFLESYGRTSVDNPLYAPTHLPRLQASEALLAAEGLAARSLWLTSPIAGGQSWLAHGTFASGLPTGDQGRYRAMLASPRKTLFHLARDAGYRTGAVMPAITMDWPEGPRLGFETILAAADLGYAGAPFNWVTMPDQYTLAAYPRHMGDDPRPDFLQIALISSHAPWTPVPWMLDWEEVGDGRIFDAMAASGDTPREVWKDRGRVRDHYRRAIDYTLEATFAFAARQDEAPLMIVLGDHQPAPSISQVEGLDVPVHLIGPPEVLARLDGWGATP
ncbi:MAG: sulfatase-like hydrolase/transferase, partial [Pseudomonadota bacterium]